MYYHQCIYDAVKANIESCIAYYFPSQSEPSSRPPVYISVEAREAINEVKAAAAAAELDGLEEEMAEEEIDVEGPQIVDSAPGAHGVGLDEPMEAAAATRSSPRNSPRRQQATSVDDNAVDRIGALDNATARAMVRPSVEHIPPRQFLLADNFPPHLYDIPTSPPAVKAKI